MIHSSVLQYITLCEMSRPSFVYDYHVIKHFHCQVNEDENNTRKYMTKEVETRDPSKLIKISEVLSCIT